MKNVLDSACSIKPESYKADGSMTQRIEPGLKEKILKFLNAPEAGVIGSMPMIDPVTGEIYSRENVIRESDGFAWSSGAIYMFDKYDIKLSDDFINFISKA